MPIITSPKSNLKVTTAKVRKVEAQLKAATTRIRDTNKNGEVDNFELAAAMKQARLGAASKSALWSAKGTAEMTADPDGRNNVTDAAGIRHQLTRSAGQLVGLASGGVITKNALLSSDAGSTAQKLFEAARKTRLSPDGGKR